MPFDLSFSPEFYSAPGEPDDTDAVVNSKGQPVSLYGAIVKLVEGLSKADLAGLASLVKSAPGTEGFAWDLLGVAKRTNSCTDLGSPVEVWIDPAGSFRVRVYPDDSSSE